MYSNMAIIKKPPNSVGLEVLFGVGQFPNVYFKELIHLAIFSASSFGTCGMGAMGV